MRVENCPCDLGKPYDACCGRYHAGDAAPSALALMRSRYSAYVLRLDAYLLDTWHASTRPMKLVHDEHTKWLRLEIERHAETGDEGEVEFVAVYKSNGRAQRLHEKSRFVREAERWFYVSGDHQ